MAVLLFNHLRKVLVVNLLQLKNLPSYLNKQMNYLNFTNVGHLKMDVDKGLLVKELFRFSAMDLYRYRHF